MSHEKFKILPVDSTVVSFLLHLCLRNAEPHLLLIVVQVLQPPLLAATSSSENSYSQDPDKQKQTNKPRQETNKAPDFS